LEVLQERLKIMCKPTLLILAAGIGSRYGGLKQLDSVGVSQETILEYSIYDAIKAGFKKVVFVVKKDILNHFISVFNKKLKERINTEYITQELNKIPIDITFNKKRKKPWGTAHAVWVAKDVIDTNFAVINADDFYGYDAFQKIHDFLINQRDDENYALMGYKLSNTISKHGGVSRGICSVLNGYLSDIKEYHHIEQENNKIIGYFDNNKTVFSINSLVSMNLWGFSPSIFKYISLQFKEFLKEEGMNSNSEFYIPTVVDNLIKKNLAKVEVLQTNARWHGITYKEDKPTVKTALKKYVKKGNYPSNLWV